ncbi:MAG: transglycosylase SLT domain-containing protein, partial [Spirochaetaceae bacterium]|jgi:soluble lytic murein transglycosylase|nr:transglycosylase SLT domain-containing protein [Spirochaetaceae bacterium]
VQPREEVLDSYRRILAAKDYESLLALNLNPRQVSDIAGVNALYFFGLHYTEAGDEKNALRFFTEGKQKAFPFFSRLCAEELTRIGTAPARLAVAKQLYRKNSSDITAAALYAENLRKTGNYKAILKMANSTDTFSELTSDNQSAVLSDRINLTGMVIEALLAEKNENFIPLLEQWVTGGSFTAQHILILEKLFAEQSYPERIKQLGTVIQMRTAVFQRNYGEAAAQAAILIKEEPLFPAAVYSDMGRALLYGSEDHRSNAELFLSIADNAADPESRFMGAFYAARCFNRSEDSAPEMYLTAMNLAETPSQYDNALWYYLTTLLAKDRSRTIDALASYAPWWSDPDYFSDFLDQLSAALMAERDWNNYYKTYHIIRDHASPDSLAQFSYVTARLLEEGYISPSVYTSDPEAERRECLETAYSSDHGNLYYRTLAADRLNIPFEDIPESFLHPAPQGGTPSTEEFTSDTDFEALLTGYADFGFPERIYPAYVSKTPASSRHLSPDTVIYLAEQLYNAGEQNPLLYAQSLRLTSSSVAQGNIPVTQDILEKLYPRPYRNYVSEASSQFRLEEHLLYGLIRTESYFDKDAYSHAGAIGLAQLMRPTAGDVARKLKIQDYDLLDAQINIMFGAYYLSELLGRLDNVPIMALFSYNGGITRVRNWIRSAGNLPADLFLETVPFAETRGYGRKVLSAAVLYGYLYDDLPPEAIVHGIFAE